MSGAATVRAGALVGLLMASLYAAVLLAVQATRDQDGAVPFATAFAVAYLAPFVCALMAGRIPDVNLRIAVWMAAGVLSIMLSFTSLAGVTLPLLVPGFMLLLGAWRVHRESRCRPRLVALGLSLGLVVGGIASLLLVLRNLPVMSLLPWIVALAAVAAMRVPGHEGSA